MITVRHFRLERTGEKSLFRFSCSAGLQPGTLSSSELNVGARFSASPNTAMKLCGVRQPCCRFPSAEVCFTFLPFVCESSYTQLKHKTIYIAAAVFVPLG